MGRGEIVFERNVTFGVSRAPGFYSSYGYVESRESTAKIVFGENTHLNNGCSVVAESCAIRIGSGCLVGDNVVIYDSDFHPLDPIMRHQSRGHVGDVLIGDNVFVGSNAIILKNSSIGPGSVIAAGAVVSGRFPENSLIAGNPATVIRKL
jgi:acetyltransferase-like isoleucine patch superfamily enzyme